MKSPTVLTDAATSAPPTASRMSRIITFNAEAAEAAEEKCPGISRRALRALRSNVVFSCLRVFVVAFLVGQILALRLGEPVAGGEADDVDGRAHESAGVRQLGGHPGPGHYQH